MSYEQILSQTGIKHFEASGTGSTTDPFIPTTNVTAETATSITNFAATIGSSSTEVLAANTNRKIVILVNDSDEAIYIALGASATMNSGIRLNANGGALVLDDPIYKGVINAICSSGSKKLVGVEGT